MNTKTTTVPLLIAILTLSGCATSDSARLDMAEDRIKVLENCCIRKMLGLRDDDQPSIAGGIDPKVAELSPYRRFDNVGSRLQSVNNMRDRLNDVERRIRALEAKCVEPREDMERRLKDVENYILYAKSGDGCCTNAPLNAESAYPFIIERLKKLELRVGTLGTIDLLSVSPDDGLILNLPVPTRPVPTRPARIDTVNRTQSMSSSCSTSSNCIR